MGVKELWPFLEPYSERKPLFELQGKVVAIDLAGWVCESLCVVDYSVQPRFYLRNLFFRTCYLLLSGVTPVYVLEGSAPALKYGVICKRNETQFIGARPRNAPASQTNIALANKPKPANRGRSAFNHVLKQCEELIVSMGLTCVQGPGEAEAFCAYMNQSMMVDGVISQDSDCFAYGATRVYRNFSVASQGKTAAQGGSVDVYDLSRVPKEMDFGQFKMIAMALLCGCDYCPDGVGGVGRDATMKLFNLYSNQQILNRLQEWRENSDHFTDLELRVDDKGVCVNCGHRGKLMVHTKSGCGDCRQQRGCNEALWKEQRLAIKSELTIRKKALQLPTFPSQAIIDEFLIRPVTLPPLDLNWKQPNVIKFLRCMTKMLQWDEIYCFQKFLPILTRWQLYHVGNAEKGQQLKFLLGSVQPDFIKKKRSPKGVASYEVIWKDGDKCFDGLIPDEQISKFKDENPNDPKLLWSTIEPVDLVQNAYPAVVEAFFAATLAKSKKKPSSKKRGAAPKPTTVPSIVPKKRKKKTDKTTEPRTPILIERFLDRIKNPRPKSVSPKPAVTSTSPKIRTSSKPMNLSQFSFSSDADWSKLDDSHELSAVINSIVNRRDDLTEICGRKLRYEVADSALGSNIQTEKTNSVNIHDVINNTEHNDYEPFNQIPEEIPNQTSINESMDEFDLMVMGKAPSLQHSNGNSSTPIMSRKPKRPSIVFIDSPITQNNTPILFKPSLLKSMGDFPDSPINQNGTPIECPIQSPKHNSIPSGEIVTPNEASNENEAPNLNPFKLNPETTNDSLSVSHFFEVNASDEIDEFEKSIDYRKMPDELPSKTRVSSRRPSMRTSVGSVRDDSSFQLNNYKPIGAKLRKRFKLQ